MARDAVTPCIAYAVQGKVSKIFHTPLEILQLLYLTRGKVIGSECGSIGRNIFMKGFVSASGEWFAASVEMR